MIFQPQIESVKNNTWKILIIDDDEDDYFLAREMLKEARGRKYDVHWAPTFEVGQEELTSEPYHAVLVDYDLGRRSGIELIREASERGYPAPFILFTGRGNFEVDVEAMQAGATMYLTKGEANPLLLERAIRYAVERKHTEEALRQARDNARWREEVLNERNEALRQSEEKFARTFQFNPAAMTITRLADGKYTDANQSFCEMVGYSREEIVGRSSVELGFFSNEMRQVVLRQFGETGHVHQQEFRLTSKHGAQLTVLFSLDPIEAAGEPSILATMVDITERKRAEDALRQNEARLRASEAAMNAFFESSPGILNLFDQELRYLKSDPITPTYFGHDRQSIIGKSVWDLNPSYAEQFLGPMLRRVLETGQPELNVEFTGPVPARQGELGNFRASYFPVPLPSGEMGFGSIAVEITDSKRAEETLRQSEAALRASEERLRQANVLLQGIIGGTQDLVAGLDKNFQYLAVNLPYRQSFKQIFGRDIEAGANMLEALAHNPEDQQNARELWQRALQGENFVITSAFGDPGLERRVFEMHFYPIRSEEGEIIAAGEIARDVTEQLYMEQALQESLQKLARSNEDLEQFAFVASHDLKEPLRKIIMFGSSLQRQSEGQLDEASQDSLLRMQNAAERMQAMIDGLLELSRVSTRGKEFTQVDLTLLVKEVVFDLEPGIQSLHGQVQVERLPTLNADALQLRRLFQNLIGNALKFHKPGMPPVVRVSGTVREGDESPVAAIRVADNGIGIEPENIDRIFQPFQRLHGRSAYEGTGLGLAICQKIVERHHGHIEVQSTPGEGSVFIVHLPVK